MPKDARLQDESDDDRGEGGNEGEGGETFMIQNTAKRSYPLRSRGRWYDLMITYNTSPWNLQVLNYNRLMQ